MFCNSIGHQQHAASEGTRGPEGGPQARPRQCKALKACFTCMRSLLSHTLSKPQEKESSPAIAPFPPQPTLIKTYSDIYIILHRQFIIIQSMLDQRVVKLPRQMLSQPARANSAALPFPCHPCTPYSGREGLPCSQAKRSE